MLSLTRTLASSLGHIFFPHICKGCGADLPGHKHELCRSCLASLPYTHFESLEGNPVEKTFLGRASLRAASSLLFFTPSSLTQHLIHQFKYAKKQELARYLGRMMGGSMLRSGRFTDIDLVVPLPLHKGRLRQRGYNQAALLSEGISECLGATLLPDALLRHRSAATQTQRSREDRWHNVKGQFSANGNVLRGHILLVDDVITTGATLDACASVINAIPGTTLSIATLALAMK